MKALATSLLALIFLLEDVSAALYTFNNGTADNAHGITDASGRAFRGETTEGQVFTGTSTNGNWTSAGPGALAVGFFSTDNLSAMTSTQLLGAFTNLTSGAVAFSAGPGGVRSTFTLTPPDTIITGSIYQNQSIYLFAGNGTTLENSTQFLILKHNRTFLASDDTPPLDIISFTPSNTTLLFGTNVSDVRTTNTDSSVTAGWAMAAPIPEPSTSLLGLIGAVVLLRRRRA